MMTPPPLPDRDAGQLKLLATFHYVIAGLDILFVAPALLHYWFMSTLFADPKVWEKAKEPPPFDPQAFFQMMIWVYVLWVGMQVASAVLNFLSGRFLQAGKNRTFSLVAAGIGCLHMPLGTALGIFTLNVLLRESVARQYAARKAAGTPLRPEGVPPPLVNPELERLRVLAIFHYVNGGLHFLGSAMGLFMFFTMLPFFAGFDANVPEGQSGPRSEEIFAFMSWLVAGLCTLFLILAVLNFCAGRLMSLARGRNLAYVVAALNCLNMPAGMVLGIFTFITLARPGVALLYSQAAATSGGPSASSS